MLSPLWEWLTKNVSVTIALLFGVLIVTSVFIYPQLWGERSVGVIIGVAATAVILTIVEKIVPMDWQTGAVGLWLIVVIATLTALTLRLLSKASIRPSVQFSIPPLPSSQTIFVAMASVILIVLVVELVLALNRGQSVGFESHWGGLGGGTSGWTLSTPLIYLLGIILVLAISSAVGWRLFPPHNQAASQSPTTTPSTSASPTPSSSPAAAAANR